MMWVIACGKMIQVDGLDGRSGCCCVAFPMQGCLDPVRLVLVG